MINKKSQPQLAHPLEIYSKHLTTINDVKPTQREIDVISCLLHMGSHTRKYIANILFIDVKTVNLHISNASNKLIGYCNVDRLVTFLESSEQSDFLKTYYLALRTDHLFKKALQEEVKPEVDKLTFDQPISLKCVFVYCQKKPLFLETLKKDLLCAGLEVSLETRKEISCVEKLIEENYPNTYAIYFLPEGAEDHKSQPFTHTAPTDGSPQFSDTKIFFFSKSKEAEGALQELSHFTFINSSEWDSYYSSVFVILQKFLPDLGLDDVFDNFKDKTNTLCSSPFTLPSALSEKTAAQEKSEIADDASQTTQILASKRAGYVVVGILSVGIFFLWTLKKDEIRTSHQKKTNYFSSHNDSTASDNLTTHSIRSDLSIPTYPTFLNRSNVIAQIDQKFHNQNKAIQTIALVGVGGAGKTTLARQYARSQGSTVIWEMNAVSKESLSLSYESLAYAFSKTESDKRALRELQGIKNLSERADKLVLFVKEKLKLRTSWFLIFDNVEDFSDIRKHFPSDPETWGAGRILITTNDAHIQNNKLINHILPIKELDGEEKLQLFMNIMHAGNDPPFTHTFSLIEKEQVKEFLNSIPSYPLDISIAAYYLKTTHISYEKYLRYLEAYDTSFEIMQKKMLKVASDYIKTRYLITSLFIKKIINSHEDFKGLLLLISLLSSQNIPKNLLDTYQKGTVVDAFIYELKKYSLITHDTSSAQTFSCPTLGNSSFLSLHRSTQSISLNYLIQESNLSKNDPLLQKVVTALETYMDKAIIDEHEILLMKSHCEVLYSHKALFNENGKATIRCILAMISCYLGHFEKAKQLLEEILALLNRDDAANSSVLARTLGYLGMVHRIMGNYGQAKKFLEESMTVYRHRTPTNNIPSNDLKVAWTLEQLGIVYKELKDYDTAKKFIEEGLNLYKLHCSANDPQIVWVLATLGIVYKEQGDYEQAKILLGQSLAIYKDKFSVNHKRVAWVLGHLGVTEQEMGNLETAREILEESSKIYKNHLTESHIYYAWVLANLGGVYIELGDHIKAKSLLEKSLNIYSNHFSNSHEEVTRVRTMLGKAYMNCVPPILK